MNDQEFRAMLDWYMCSDPWPVDPDDNGTHEMMTELLNRESRKRGYDGWVDAYHIFGVPS